MQRRTRTRATWGVAGALAVVVVSGAVVGTRDVGRSLEPGVADAVRATAPDQVGFEVEGREVSIDPWAAPSTVVRRAVRAVEEVPGVRSVRVRPVVVEPGADARPGDVDLSLEVSDTGVAFSSAVPSRALADEIGRRAAQVRGVPVAVDLAVDTTLPTPRWWPALGQVLDVTAQVGDLRIDVRGDQLEVEGSTVSAGSVERAARALDELELPVRVRASITTRASGLSPGSARVLESTQVPFGIGSAVLGPRGRAALDDVAAVMRRTDVSLDVLGHAGPADPERGDALAAQRAATVRAFLVARGVDASRLVVTAIGSGADRGIDPLSPQYRKVDFRVEEER